jgi:hypothetical protein
MGWACSTNGEEERVYVIGGISRRKDTTKKTNMQVAG